MAHIAFWKNPHVAIDQHGSFVLEGYSVAAQNTGFYVRALNIMLDCGVPNFYRPTGIFITHGHHDHIKELSGTMMGMGNVHTSIFCPAFAAQSVRNVIHSVFSLANNTPTPRIHNKYTLCGVRNGDKIPFKFDKKNKKPTWFVEAIHCYHGVPCVGYGFIEIRSKLKPEYIGIEKNELCEIAKQGTIITHDVEFPIFCFLGDTNEKVLENPLLEKYPTIITECTFIDPEHIKNAHEDNHMHWNYLKSYIMARPTKRFILTHFSARYGYTNDYVVDFFKKQNCPNVVPFISLPSNTEKDYMNRMRSDCSHDHEHEQHIDCDH